MHVLLWGRNSGTVLYAASLCVGKPGLIDLLRGTEELPIRYRREARIYYGGAVRELVTCARRRYGELAADEARVGELCARGNSKTLMRAAETIGRRGYRTAANCGVPVHCSDIGITKGPEPIAPVSAIPAVSEATSPPGMTHLERRQRDPTQSTEADSKSSPPEEAHESRAPRVGCSNPSWPPAPTMATVPEPTSIVIRRPSPWRIVDPGPTVVRLVCPLAVAIRRPIRGGWLWLPDLPVLRRYPVAIRVQIICSVDVRADMPVALGSEQLTISIRAPVVELIACDFIALLKLRIGRISAHENGVTGGKRLRTTGTKDLHLT